MEGSSTSVMSYPLRATTNSTALTSSKQLIHFLLSVRWPPTSYNLQRNRGGEKTRDSKTYHWRTIMGEIMGWVNQQKKWYEQLEAWSLLHVYDEQTDHETSKTKSTGQMCFIRRVKNKTATVAHDGAISRAVFFQRERVIPSPILNLLNRTQVSPGHSSLGLNQCSETSRRADIGRNLAAESQTGDQMWKGHSLHWERVPFFISSSSSWIWQKHSCTRLWNAGTSDQAFFYLSPHTHTPAAQGERKQRFI